MKWEEILKNIQISSQKTSSRDYVLPDEDEQVPDVEQEEEDCSQWWIDLMDMCDNLLEKWGGNKYKRSGYRGPIQDFSKKELCQKKQEIINSTPDVINRYSSYENKTFDRAVIRFGKIDSAFIRFICNSDESPVDARLDEVPTLEINIAINNKHIYHKVVKIDYTNRPGKPGDIGGHIGHGYKFSVFLLRCIRMFKDWKGGQNLEKSIQIGSQKTSSRDYVLPDGDDEDCFKWWNGLFKIIKRMILELNSEYNTNTLDNINFKNLTNEYLCKKKEEVLRNPTQFFSVVTGYLKFMGEPGNPLNFIASIDDYTPSIVFLVKLHVHVTPVKEEVFIQLEENTKDIKTYSPAAALELVRKFHTAELDLMDYLNINGNPLLTQSLIEIYDDYLREIFDVKKNIQISGQKTSSRDYVLPDEDDEDCREWWRELHKIYNKMISAIDRNATLVINNEVEKADNQLLCELRDSILAMDVEQNTDGIYGRNFVYKKEGIGPYTRSDGVTINVGTGGISIRGNMLDTKPGPYSGPYATRLNDRISLSSYYGKYPNWNNLFWQNVSIWNDSILYELNKLKEKGEVYAYNLVEKFLQAELELKKHINDPNPSPFIASKLIAIYETYLNSDVKKSINIAGQKTSSMNYVVDDDEEDCREQVLKIADKIMKFSYSDEFNMNNPVRESKYSKFYIKDYYEGMSADEMNNSDRLSLETHFIEKLDEETCCLILETIDKYKGQNLVEVEVRAPMTDGHSEGVFIYTKEISPESCFIQIFFPSGKHIAATLSLKLDQKVGIPPDIAIEIKEIFESR